MAAKHFTTNRLPDNFTLESRTHDDIQTALLYDIRRAAERTARATEATLSVQRRIDRRLAKRIKLR